MTKHQDPSAFRTGKIGVHPRMVTRVRRPLERKVLMPPRRSKWASTHCCQIETGGGESFNGTWWREAKMGEPGCSFIPHLRIQGRPSVWGSSGGMPSCKNEKRYKGVLGIVACNLHMRGFRGSREE